MSNEVFDASAEFKQFIFLAISLGLNNLQKQGSLIPMIVSVSNGAYALGALAVDANQVMDAAANQIRELPIETDYSFKARVKSYEHDLLSASG